MLNKSCRKIEIAAANSNWNYDCFSITWLLNDFMVRWPSARYRRRRRLCRNPIRTCWAPPWGPPSAPGNARGCKWVFPFQGISRVRDQIRVNNLISIIFERQHNKCIFSAPELESPPVHAEWTPSPDVAMDGHGLINPNTKLSAKMRLMSRKWNKPLRGRRDCCA